jgi:pilus assembly protein Flp/PilA
MANVISERFRAEEGQGLTEYALILVLVALIAMAGLTLLGGELRDLFQRIADALPF